MRQGGQVWYEVQGYRLTGGHYWPIPLNEKGWIYSAVNEVWIGPNEARDGFVVIDAKTGERILPDRLRADVAEERAENEAAARAEAEQKAQAEAEARAEAQRKAQAEAEARAEAQRVAAEAKEHAQAEAEARAEAQRKAEAEAEARAEAERKAEAEAAARVEAEGQVKSVMAELARLRQLVKRSSETKESDQ